MKQCVCHHGNWQTVSSLKEKKGGRLDVRGQLLTEHFYVQWTPQKKNHNLIGPLFLPFSLLYIYVNVFPVLLCLLFPLPVGWWFLTQHNSDTTINTSLQLYCPQEREQETNRAPGWLECQHFNTRTQEQTEARHWWTWGFCHREDCNYYLLCSCSTNTLELPIIFSTSFTSSWVDLTPVGRWARMMHLFIAFHSTVVGVKSVGRSSHRVWDKGVS